MRHAAGMLLALAFAGVTAHAAPTPPTTGTSPAATTPAPSAATTTTPAPPAPPAATKGTPPAATKGTPPAATKSTPPAATKGTPPAATTPAPLPATTTSAPAGASPAAAPIEVTTLAPQPILYVVVRTRPAALAGALQRAFLGLLGSVTTTGVEIAGPPLARYVSRGTAADPTFVVEAALPVKQLPADALPTGLRAATLPGGAAATLVVTGPHTGLVAAHAALDGWLVTAKRTPAGARWEVFLTNPMMTPDPAAQRTRVVVPLRPPVTAAR